MGFQVFDRRHAPMRGEPSVTLQSSGVLSINAPAHRMIDNAMKVELLFDPSREVMALRPSEGSPRSYELREPTSTGLTMVSLTAFANAYGIDLSTSRRFQPFLEDGMLCVDLKGESVAVRGNRSRGEERRAESPASNSPN